MLMHSLNRNHENTSEKIILKVLGSGTCVPSAARFPASYFIQPHATSGGWMLDMGSGSLQRLEQAGESYQTLERIFISHAHPDHTSSIIPLMQALQHTPDYTRTDNLTVYGPDTVREYLELHFSITPTLRPEFPFEFIVLDEGSAITDDAWQLRSLAMNHGTSTLGFRFTIGRCILVYGADSGPSPAIADLARDADLLILEASFPQGKPSTQHLTTTEAGQIAKDAGVAQLLLTHLYPEIDQMSTTQREAEVRAGGFTGDIIFAEDLMELQVTGGNHQTHNNT